MQSSVWRAEIAGLRALAIVPVVFFHYGVPGFAGGFVGVDIFFVISGFLITQMIQANPDTFRLSDFYVRRIRRLFPALYLMLFVVTAAALAIFTPFNLLRYGRTLAASALFVSNLLAAKETRYFDSAVIERPLVHTWSLAIEEQFYLIFPLLLVALPRSGPRKAAIILVLFVASWLGAIIFGAGKGGFFATPWRAWELMGGALLALGAAPRPSTVLAPWLSWTGLAAIVAAVTLFGPAPPTPGLPTLLPCAGAALIILAGGPVGAGRLLALAPFRAIGAISYPLYLWHWPALVFYRYIFLHHPVGIQIAALTAGTTLLAAATYWLVERPVRTLPRPVLLTGAALATATAAAVGLTLEFSHGLEGQLRATRAAPAAERQNDRVCFLDNRQRGSEWTLPRCTFAASSVAVSAPDLWLWGDSHAAHYLPGLMGLMARQDPASFRLVESAYSACPPLVDAIGSLPSCAAFNRTVLAAIAQRPPRAVILAASWANDAEAGRPAMHSAHLGAAVEQTIRRLKALGVEHILVIGETPAYAIDVPQMVFALSTRHLALQQPPENDFRIDDLLSQAAVREGAQFFAPRLGLCQDRTCRLTDEKGRVLQWDNSHLSLAGSHFMAEQLAPNLTALLSAEHLGN